MEGEFDGELDGISVGDKVGAEVGDVGDCDDSAVRSDVGGVAPYGQAS